MRFLILVVLALSSVSLKAADAELGLVIQEHRFVPSILNIPAGKKFRLNLENKDPTPEEFESYLLNREKTIPGNGRITLIIGPLDPGTYPFFGEFHTATARGTLVVQ